MRDMKESEIAGLAKVCPAGGADAASGVFDLMNDLLRQSGDYTLKTAAGQTRRLNVALPSPQEITGPWKVTFDPRWGGPAQPQEFSTLTDLSRRPE